MDGDFEVTAVDPQAHLFADPSWREMWWADLAARAAQWDEEHPPEADVVRDDVRRAEIYGAAHDLDLDELQAAAREGRMLVARQYRVIASVIANAAESPDPWVGADPTLDPAWVDRRSRSVAAVRRERRDIAVRAAVLDIAVRLQIAEATVRARAAHADALLERCPRVWSAFLVGDVAEQNAVAAAQFALTLPAEEPRAWQAFDEAIVERATRLTPVKFRHAARIARERIHPETLEVRHGRAADERGVWIDPLLDGMAMLSVKMRAPEARASYDRIDRAARHLQGQEGGGRTLAQLRADVTADLLQHAAVDGDGDGSVASKVPRASIAVTVPVLTLLGEGTEPAMLDGYGPIDSETAKRLAGGASSWVRILTHPVTCAPLALDRAVYRVPRALRRWLGVVHPTCVSPGCNRSARKCDIDHFRGWAQGGRTDAVNLGPQCEAHHVVKTESLWRVEVDVDTGEPHFISPTGYVSALDPPPF
jgi:hypothetical protein